MDPTYVDLRIPKELLSSVADPNPLGSKTFYLSHSRSKITWPSQICIRNDLTSRNRIRFHNYHEVSGLLINRKNAERNTPFLTLPLIFTNDELYFFHFDLKNMKLAQTKQEFSKSFKRNIARSQKRILNYTHICRITVHYLLVFSLAFQPVLRIRNYYFRICNLPVG